MYRKEYHPKVSLVAVFYETPTGNAPVRAWLHSLSKAIRRTIGADIHSVQTLWPVGKPLVDGFGDGLWEVRSTHDRSDFRVLFGVVDGKMYLLHGFMKQSAATSRADKALAVQRLRDVKASARRAGR